MSHRRLVDAAILTAPLAAAASLAIMPWDRPTACPVALFTGTACPGCGLTRALGAIVAGDPTASWAYHPLAVPMALLAVTAWAWFVLWRSGRARPPSAALVNVTLASTAAVLVLVWVARLLAGTLPPV